MQSILFKNFFALNNFNLNRTQTFFLNQLSVFFCFYKYRLWEPIKEIFSAKSNETIPTRGEYLFIS